MAGSNPTKLVATWRDDASILRLRGAGNIAEVLEGCANELEAALGNPGTPPTCEGLAVPLARRDRLLTVPEVAERLGVPTRYVYDHWPDWPFAKKVGCKLRFSEMKMEAWMQHGGDT